MTETIEARIPFQDLTGQTGLSMSALVSYETAFSGTGLFRFLIAIVLAFVLIPAPLHRFFFEKGLEIVYFH